MDSTLFPVFKSAAAELLSSIVKWVSFDETWKCSFDAFGNAASIQLGNEELVASSLELVEGLFLGHPVKDGQPEDGRILLRPLVEQRSYDVAWSTGFAVYMFERRAIE